MAKQASGPAYSLAALRALALHTQCLTTPYAAASPSTPDTIVDLVTALGYVQIDTLNVVNRAHYSTLWARLGSYRLDALNALIYTADQRRLYEGWGHAASIIPLEHYRYHRWRTDPTYSFNPVYRTWLDKAGNRELVAQTLARIRSEGGLRVGDFAYAGPQRSVWYDWKPPKMALEALFAWGDLMVTDRVNFQRVYDVKERVLPAWVDTSPIPDAAARRFCLEQAAKALGVFDLRHLTFYAYMRATPVKAEVQELVNDGKLLKIQGESLQGIRTWMIHRDTLPLLQRAAAGMIRAQRTTFLPPSTRFSGRRIATNCFGASNNFWNAINLPPSGSTVISPSRSSTTIAWWAVSTPSWIVHRVCCTCMRCTLNPTLNRMMSLWLGWPRPCATSWHGMAQRISLLRRALRPISAKNCSAPFRVRAKRLSVKTVKRLSAKRGSKRQDHEDYQAA